MSAFKIPPDIRIDNVTLSHISLVGVNQAVYCFLIVHCSAVLQCLDSQVPVYLRMKPAALTTPAAAWLAGNTHSLSPLSHSFDEK